MNTEYQSKDYSNLLDSSNGRISEYSEDESQAQRITLTITLLLSSQ